MIARGAE